MCMHDRLHRVPFCAYIMYRNVYMFYTPIEKLGVKAHSVCGVSFCKPRCITLISAISLLFRTIYMARIFFALRK